MLMLFSLLFNQALEPEAFGCLHDVSSGSHGSNISLVFCQVGCLYTVAATPAAGGLFVILNLEQALCDG